MNKKTTNSDAVYQGIRETCRITGLSQYYLRNLAKSGQCPAVLKAGRVYLFDVEALLTWLKSEGK